MASALWCLCKQSKRSAVTRPADRSSQVTGDQLLAVNWRRASMHMYSCINLIKHLKHNNKHKIDTIDRQLIDALVGKYFKYLHLTLMLIIIEKLLNP